MRAARRYDVYDYVAQDGSCPFRSWLTQQTKGVQIRIEARVYRFRLGNLRDVKPVGGGIMEARLDFGPGYRIYFGIDGDDLLIVGAGTKNTQQHDIRRAQQCWRVHKEGQNRAE